MAPKTFSIVFDDSDAVFFPGQTVKGRVLFEHGKDVSTTGIEMESKGVAKSHFTRTKPGTSPDDTNAVPHHYSTTEYYFKLITPHYHEGGHGFTLKKDHPYSYKFAFTLPAHIPPSYEGKHGHVRYFIKAVIRRHWVHDYECKMGFTVNTIADLNAIPNSIHSVHAEKSKEVSPTATITAAAWLERTAYVPGEAIRFNAKLNNPANFPIRGYKVQLVEHATFYAEGVTETHSRAYAEVERKDFVENPDEWRDVAVVVPPLVPSNFQYCNIIQVEYKLHFVVELATIHNDKLVVPLNIIIGNVPLRKFFSNFHHQAPAAEAVPDGHEGQVAAHWADNPLASHFLPNGQLAIQYYPDLPRPDFHAGITVTDIRDEEDSKNINNGAGVPYAPRYILYHQK